MADDPQISSLASQKVKVTTKDFGAKFKGKREVYHFLAHEVGAYLCSYDTVTIWHLRDIMAGKRKMVKGTDVKYIDVPHYENLTIDKMLTYASHIPDVMKALPEVEKETLKMSRAYIANIIHTLVGMPFRKWVKERVDERHFKVAEERDLLIEMDPEIGEIYKASQAISGK